MYIACFSAPVMQSAQNKTIVFFESGTSYWHIVAVVVLTVRAQGGVLGYGLAHVLEGI